MAANTTPIWPVAPNVSWTPLITAANTNMDGTGTTNIAWTAGAEGGLVESVKLKAGGTNVATVARIFLNNGSTNTTAANNTLIAEQTLAATTASAVAGLAEYEIWLNKKVDPGYRILVVLGTAVAAGWQATVYGGDY